MYNVNEWQHVFKLDPNKEITDEDLEKVCESGTDAVIVGGTDHVTLDDVLNLLARVRRYSVPCVLEMSNLDAITPGFDFYFIPMVMNSRDKKWMMDIQHQAVKEYGDIMNWEELLVEGYCILNEEAKAFRYTDSILPSKEDVIAYARMAEHMYNLPIFYMEYSGLYGDADLVKEVKDTLEHTCLFYGGGITTTEQAKEMKQHADVIVVGNIIYEDLKAALKTVKAAKG
ncbi:heptaprenylglyceryl phosphate synthase [Thalassobacillus devorans]|uniref:Heptaprenylglyceryl phosphate synthase n=1 Tax=Thalassobacillus devorans TaxID=279813 RepID=A0ABQ1PJS8_9BACI|nr:heptaprenylglyceryl phosphate synthase [Thalassobacillus devorans]NIK30108.1 putative glycerol-1-phosphate prenyltransferase [Thalassobacillus devorans]GGC98407.1 heptaprenylglyceryl phosphate synthase [Thalassobacillus devorans]